MVKKKQKERPLASLGRPKAKKVVKKAPKKALKPLKKQAGDTGVRIALLYSDAEISAWIRQWKNIPGLPNFVIKGKTRDGYYGVAIVRKEGRKWILNHVCYPTRDLREQLVRALVYLCAAAGE